MGGINGINTAASQVAGSGAAAAQGASQVAAQAPATGAGAPTGWVTPEKGLADVVKVSGEEPVAAVALRRDDDLGQLAARAFDPEAARAALPPLKPETAEAFRRMAQSTYDAKKTIIGNMVDTPEERKAKDEREAERRTEEDDREMRLEKLEDKERLANDGLRS